MDARCFESPGPECAGVGGIIGGSCDNSAPDTNALSGQCTIIVSSSATGTSTVNAAAVVGSRRRGGSDQHPVSTTGHGAHDISNTVIWVDARNHHRTVRHGSRRRRASAHLHGSRVEQITAPAGWSWPVNVLVPRPAKGASPAAPCDNIDGDTELDGMRTIVVSSTAAGTLSVDATATIVVSGVAITRSASGSALHGAVEAATCTSPDTAGGATEHILSARMAPANVPRGGWLSRDLSGQCPVVSRWSGAKPGVERAEGNGSPAATSPAESGRPRFLTMGGGGLTLTHRSGASASSFGRLGFPMSARLPRTSADARPASGTFATAPAAREAAEPFQCRRCCPPFHPPRWARFPGS